MRNVILFDLDGTLTDPGLGITNSVIYALNKLGIQVEDRTELYKFIGPPLLNSFMDFYGFDKEKAEQAVRYYRECYGQTGMLENEVYDGIRELLRELKKAGKHLLVATSKPEFFAKQILDYFDLSEYFCVIAGSDMEGVRNTKGKVIEYALNIYVEKYGTTVQDIKATTIMVGDRLHDIEGAKEHEITSVGVLFGYGTREELEQAGADYIIESPSEMISIVR